nr:hypothetical protein [Nostoc sp. DedQUE01]
MEKIIKNIFKLNLNKSFYASDKLKIIFIVALIFFTFKTYYYSAKFERISFNSSQCEMYSYGFIHSGQMFKIRTSSGDLFIMFSNTPDTPKFFRNRGVYSWTTREKFIELLPNIFTILSPSTSNKFSQLLDANQYVGIVSEEFKTVAKDADNKCY